MGRAQRLHKERREALLAKEAEAKAQVERWFDEFDHSGEGTLTQDELDELLTHICRQELKDPAAEVPDDVTARILKKCDKSGDGVIDKKELMPLVLKYKALIAKDLEVEAELKVLFEKYDMDQGSSGELTSAELLPLLQELAKDTPVGTAVAADVDFVIERCDKDGDGSIDFTELGSVVVLWKEVAQQIEQMVEETSGGSSACVLL